MTRALVFQVFGKVAGSACGIVGGAVFAMLILEGPALLKGGPEAWSNIARGDVGVVFATEWNIALQTACYIAFVGMVFWAIIAWFKLAGYVSAATLGFFLTCAAAWLFVRDNPENTVAATAVFSTLFGMAGMFAGLLTIGTDRVISRAVALLEARR